MTKETEAVNQVSCADCGSKRLQLILVESKNESNKPSTLLTLSCLSCGLLQWITLSGKLNIKSQQNIQPIKNSLPNYFG